MLNRTGIFLHIKFVLKKMLNEKSRSQEITTGTCSRRFVIEENSKVFYEPIPPLERCVWKLICGAQLHRLKIHTGEGCRYCVTFRCDFASSL